MTKDALNPLLKVSELYCELPPFADIHDSDVLGAFEAAMETHLAEIESIATSDEAPTFVNTIEAMERAGQDLDRVAAYFFNIAGTDATEPRMEIEAQVAPKLAAHLDRIRLRSDLWERITSITSVDGAADEAEATRLLEKIREDFRRAGADLGEQDKAELARINARLSELSTAFGENLPKDTSARAVAISDRAELAGLSDDAIASLAAYAKKAGSEAPWLIPLDLPSTPALLADLDNADTRAKLYAASLARAGQGEHDNTEVVLETVRLRARRAKLLGFDTHADYVIAKETAKTAAAARKLIADLAPAAIANAEGEYKRVADLAGDEPVTGADWPYWERRRKAEEFAVDTEELKNYFELHRVIEDGVFFAAKKLYGIEVEKRDDLEGYAPGTTVWEVRQGGGETIGLIVTDYFSRPTKRGGAWMSSFRDQSKLLGRKPVVVNVMNIAETEPGTPVLLTLDEVTTAFHEFGHALHGLLSDVTYPTFSGTNVPRDFVEFPSQINENWALEPSILANYAFHVKTGEPIPAELVAAVKRAQTAGEGFATVEYLAACAIDLAWHSLTEEEAAAVTDVDAFEPDALAKLGLDVAHIAPRYRSRYFNHIFAGGYSAGYYSYLWAEVLDADGFEWFSDNGGASAANGAHFRRQVLSRGGAIDFTEAYRAFRGRDKDIEPLLRRRGLAGTEVSAAKCPQ
nr:M3 family metallopeptidase [Corynebacterium lactis]